MRARTTGNRFARQVCSLGSGPFPGHGPDVNGCVMDLESEERISALADGELEGEELRRALRGLRDDPRLCERWERYHLMGDALRKGLPARVSLDVADRVRAALEREATVAVPMWRRRRFIRQASGWAMAAALGAVAVFGYYESRVDPYREAGDSQARAMTASPALATRSEERELGLYLVNHTEMAPAAGGYRVMPYVRLVSDH